MALGGGEDVKKRVRKEEPWRTQSTSVLNQKSNGNLFGRAPDALVTAIFSLLTNTVDHRSYGVESVMDQDGFITTGEFRPGQPYACLISF
jgi:hypothetical protein